MLIAAARLQQLKSRASPGEVSKKGSLRRGQSGQRGKPPDRTGEQNQVRLSFIHPGALARAVRGVDWCRYVTERCGEERAEAKGKAVPLLVSLHSHSHLWVVTWQGPFDQLPVLKKKWTGRVEGVDWYSCVLSSTLIETYKANLVGT